MSDHDAPNSILPYYNRGLEQDRLLHDTGKLEYARTQIILQQYLPPAPATIVDVGGGAGIYALWLARLGYRVHLIDFVPLHIEQARQASANQPDSPLASAQVGDARQLSTGDASADAVLLLGPLYHLTTRDDRVQALREAHRILRPGGIVAAAVISRFASLMDGLHSGYLADPEFAAGVAHDLQTGQHRNVTNHPEYFTTAYLHHPSEIRAELEDAGLRVDTILAVEGPGWLMANFEDAWADNAQRSRLLDFAQTVETEPTIIGASAHIIAIGRKTG